MTLLARLLITLAICLIAAPTRALEVGHMEIDFRKGQYEIHMAFTVNAPAANVMSALTDFRFPDALNPDVTSKRIILERDGFTRVRTEFKGCVMFFCHATALTQDVRISGNEITADTIPDGGDFKSGRLTWHVDDNDSAVATIDFHATIEHDMFVLPVLGKFVMRKRLREQLLRTAENLEAEASR